MYSSRRLRIILMFLIVLCGVFAYSYGSRLSERNHLDAEIAQTEQQIAAALDQQAELKAKLAMQGSPDSVDAAIRQLLDMAQPGDEVLTLVNPSAAAPVASAQMNAVVPGTRNLSPPKLPVWQQWVTFFADEGSATR